MTEFTREIRFYPAFDRRDPDPEKNYGIHGVDLWFFLKGPKGTIQFHLMTQWHLPHVTKETDQRILTKAALGQLDQINLRVSYHPLPADLGYHSPVPMYEGHKPMGSTKFEWREPTEEEKALGFHSKLPLAIDTESFTPCEWVEGGLCFYDGSGLAADGVYQTLLEEGSEGVWKRLEAEYRYRFEEKKP